MSLKQYKSIARMTVLVIVTMLCGACATTTQRLNQFDNFAQAGIAYADAVPAVLDESFRVTVASDSFALIQARPSLTGTARLESIEESNKSLVARIEILNGLKRHTQLLRMYFVSLQALAQIDSRSSGMNNVADGLVDALGKLDSGIANASVGGASVRTLLAPTVTFAFASYQSAALNSELSKNAATIEKELNLQQAMLKALADSMRADLEAKFAAEDRDKIELPYIRSGTLPANWNQRRLDAFQRQIRLNSIDAAWIAAQSLRTSFVALVENRLSDAGIAALIQDINDILTVVEDVRAVD